MPTTLTDVADEGLPARVAALEATAAALTAENTALRDTVAKQDALIRKYQAMLFGTKSEKGSPGALATPVETEATPAPQPAAPPRLHARPARAGSDAARPAMDGACTRNCRRAR